MDILRILRYNGLAFLSRIILIAESYFARKTYKYTDLFHMKFPLSLAAIKLNAEQQQYWILQGN